jgi:hypothetical protein
MFGERHGVFFMLSNHKSKTISIWDSNDAAHGALEDRWESADERNRGKQRRYSITSSARASKVGGAVNPIVLAILRLIANSYLSAPDRRAFPR